jgi:hypothetical protein
VLCHHYITLRYYYIVVRTQIQLTIEQIEALRRLGAQRFLHAAGKFSSGLNDVSVNHDQYLGEDFAG